MPQGFPQNVRASFALVVMWWCLAGPSFAQNPIVDLATIRPQFESLFESRRIRDAAYGQYRMTPSSTAPSYYGSLDVALSRAIMGENLLTTLSDTQRTEWIGHLHTFAHPGGTYDNDICHHQLHRNGMTIGGLGVLGGKQLYPTTPQYAPFDQPNEIPTYLQNSINWSSQWSESHKFWGGLHMYSQSNAVPAGSVLAVFGQRSRQPRHSAAPHILGVANTVCTVLRPGKVLHFGTFEGEKVS